MDLSYIFTNFLHIRKDIAYEIASAIIDARQRLVQHSTTQKFSSNGIRNENSISNIRVNEENDDDDVSLSSGIISAKDSHTIVKKSSSKSNCISDGDEYQNDNPNNVSINRYNIQRNKILNLTNPQCNMNRMTTYLSEVDWRVFNYITQYFLQKGITFLFSE